MVFIKEKEYMVQEMKEAVVQWMVTDVIDEEQLLFWAKESLRGHLGGRDTQDLERLVQEHGKCLHRIDETTFKVVKEEGKETWGVKPYETPDAAREGTECGQFSLVLSPTGADVYFQNRNGEMLHAYKAGRDTLLSGNLEAGHSEWIGDFTSDAGDRENISYWAGFLGWEGNSCKEKTANVKCPMCGVA